MDTEKKYLDYEGLQKYHKNLITKLVNLEYDPPRIFVDVNDLCTVTNWYNNPYAVGEIQGLKNGMLVTVGYELWQLINLTTFKSSFTTFGIERKPENLGWKVISGAEVNENVLKIK